MKNLLPCLLFIILTGSISAQISTAPSGTGSIGDPYQIATLNNLYWLTQNSTAWASGKYLTQTANIDASSSSTWDAGQGFSPVGISPYFLGSYNGMGHTITGIYINRPSTIMVAMFSRIGIGGTVLNLGLVTVAITGQMYTGGLVALNEGAVQKCNISGNVGASGTSGNWIGGLVGSNQTGGSVNLCYSSATVSGYQIVGGLVGENWGGSVANSYAMGNVNASSMYAGGFIGNNSSGSVSYCFSKGVVTAPSNSGGFSAVGSAACTNSFWDTQTSGKATSVQGTGKTTAEMKLSATFTAAGWDFIGESANGSNDYWNINGAANNGYPVLQYFYTLAVTWLDFTALKKDKIVLLKWNTASDYNTKDYLVEHSVNGTSWQQKEIIKAENNTIASQQYNYSHLYPAAGNNFYRVLQRDINGSFSYSKIINVVFNTGKTALSIYPNPVTNGILNMQSDHATTIRLFNSTGMLIMSKKIQTGNQQLSVAGLAKGIYRISTEDENVKFMIQ